LSAIKKLVGVKNGCCHSFKLGTVTTGSLPPSAPQKETPFIRLSECRLLPEGQSRLATAANDFFPPFGALLQAYKTVTARRNNLQARPNSKTPFSTMP